MKGLRYLEAFICVGAFSIVVIALMSDVIGREVFGHGVFGAQRIAVWAAAVVGLVGFALVTSDAGHLRPQFADRWLPRSAEPVLGRVADLTSALICIFLGCYAVLFVHSSFALGERGIGVAIEVWPLQTILPWMFLSSAFRHLSFAAFPALKPAPRTEH
ncbi:TRAP transporter small permease subunit [Pseudorhodoferax sp. LjRoot39]|uniref:TRAP transporter small permease n=1 Tax=Pseudorhodoferax sp. LjRoot39 TaxID=3342328 RepID=UPI003ED0E51B